MDALAGKDFDGIPIKKKNGSSPLVLMHVLHCTFIKADFVAPTRGKSTWSRTRYAFSTPDYLREHRKARERCTYREQTLRP